MTRLKRHISLAANIAVACCLMSWAAGCSSDGYDTGDGRYSYLRADFCMVHATAGKTVDYLITDNGDSVRLSAPATASWLPARDTLCRALAYYDTNTHQVFTLSQVPVTLPMAKGSLDSVPTDPLTLEKAWIGGGFLNIGFAVKSGKADELDARQSIGIMVDSVSTSGDSVQAVTLRLLHAQKAVPQYYTVTGYLSVPVPAAWQRAGLAVVANGYSGEQRISAK